MPTYDYKCQKCGHRFELFQTMSAEPLTKCPECAGKVKRLIGSGSGIIFKGSGFYCTDYKKPTGGGGSEAKDKAAEKAESKTSEKTPAATAAAPKPEAKTPPASGTPSAKSDAA